AVPGTCWGIMRAALRSSRLLLAIAGRGLVTVALALLGAPCVSCGGASANAQPKAPSLWPYTGDAAQLFDDGIDPEALGYGTEPWDGATHEKQLRERTQVGDAVLRVRVLSVTSQGDDSGNGWQIALHTLEKIVGERPPPGDFTLHVSSTGTAAKAMRSLAGHLVGATVIAFVEDFARGDGAAGGELHFHLAKDNAAEVLAVQQAASQGDFQ
ncbi:MAG: hypothetical protein ACREJ3_14900, partial [Polyangiaceae bacterium]